MLSIILALIAYVCWGTADVFSTLASRKIGGHSTAFLTFLLPVIALSAYALLNPSTIPYISISNLILIITLSVLGYISFITFYEALRIGNAMVVGAIATSSFGLTTVLSYFFLKERLGLLELIAVIVIFLGAILAGCDFKKLAGGKIMDKAVVLAVIAMVTAGIQLTFVKIPVREIGWLWPSIIGTLAFPLMLIYFRFRKIPVSTPKIKDWVFIIFNVLLVYIGAYSYNIAIISGRVAIVAPIAGSAPTLFAVLAYLIFKDKITKQQVAGVIITLIGIVALSFLSV